MNDKKNPYIGRFAPTPSGPLHLGSLVAALASYLQARANQGKWLLRIDDIDPPREQAGAAAHILHTLEAFGLYWDDAVVYQSQQQAYYQQYLRQLQSQCFFCVCSRKQLKGQTVYPGSCRSQRQYQDNSAIRIEVGQQTLSFHDQLQGLQHCCLEQELGDFVIKRKDQLWSYHLSNVVDDHLMGVTDIVRGIDLLDSTFNHIFLQQQLKFKTISYGHIPVIVEKNGQKLSKQNLAKAIGNKDSISQQLIMALQLLHIDTQKIDLSGNILQQALKLWDINKLQGIKQLPNPQ